MSDPSEIQKRRNLHGKKRYIWQLKAKEADLEEKLAQCEIDQIALTKEISEIKDRTALAETELAELEK